MSSSTTPDPSRAADAAVLINNYNNAPWLRRCVDSVLEQTVQPAEIIAYDDGSDDDSLAILRSYGPRVRVLAGTREPAGLAPRERQARAIDLAFRASTAKHVHLLDGDDAFLPRRIETYEEAWRLQPDAVLVQAPMLRVDHNDGRIGELFDPNRDTRDWRRVYYKRACLDLFYPTSALAFHRGYLERRLPLDFSDGINSWADTRLCIPSVWFGPAITLREPLSVYRVRPGSASANENTRDRHAQFAISRRCFDRLAREFGQPPLPVWKNPRFWRGELRRRLPAGLGEQLARWAAARARSKTSA